MLSKHLQARTVRGMMSYARAMRTFARLECPKPPSWSEPQYEKWVDRLIDSKFRYVVSSQVRWDLTSALCCYLTAHLLLYRYQ